MQGEQLESEITRYSYLPKFLRVVCLFLFTVGIGFFVFFAFSWSIRGWVLESVMYYYILYATFFTCVFLLIPARKKDRGRIPWYDLVLASLVFGICSYFAANAWTIARIDWVPPPSVLALASSCIIFLAAVEGGRRMAGLPFAIICLLLGSYPLFAEHMPGILYGFSYPFPYLMGAFALGRQGMIGLPAEIVGNLLIGFLIFSGMLLASGAGRFFLDIALALLGRYRGGPAKVAVLSSAFFGSLTGGPIANIVATGSVTIPAMKRMGYPPHYAGAVEAVASSGGIIMPPVMGLVAFIMVVLTDIPYSTIVTAAIIPAILYYFGLLIQVDAYAAKSGLKGLPKDEIPPLLKTLKDGWPFIAVISFLVFGLVYMRWGVVAALYSSGLLFILSFTKRETMITPRKIIKIISTTGNLITYIVAVIPAIGLLLIGIQTTGSLAAITAQLVTLAQTNVILVLLMAMVVCYLFGMVGVALIPYIVLAVTAVPAIVSSTGLSVLGLHLFLVYYLIMAMITPPVCFGAFIGAAIAGAPPMKTGFTSMRLAIVLYFIPFFFVFNPALILEGPILETIYLFTLCLLGIWILGSGLEGYMLKVGRLERWSRPFLVVGGFLIALPGWQTTIIGSVMTILTLSLTLIYRRELCRQAG